MILADLLKNIKIENIQGDMNRDIEYISLNSRETNNRTAFIAIKGFVTDGHKYIDNAIENGSNVIFHERELEDYQENITYIQLKNTRYSLAELSSALFENPSKELDIVGITGTNGKTTSTYMLENILNYNNYPTASIGSIGLKIKDENIVLGNTTPESNKLQKIFRDLVDRGIENCVMEVSSHALDLGRADKVDFDYGIFTNLTFEHLELHKTMEAYYQAKKRLFYMTSKSNLINIDDEYGRRLVKELKEDGKNVLTYSLEEEADYMAKNIETTVTNSTFDFVTPKGKIKIFMPMSATFNIYNAVAAMGIACEMGLDLKDIAKGMKKFNNPEGRYEVVENNKDLNLVIDFAHTPDAIENILKFVKDNIDKRIIVLFGVQGARTVETRETMGEVVGKYADFSIITKDDELFDNIDNISKSIIKGMEKYSKDYVLIKDRREAVKEAINMATPDDIVLFLGKGNERFLKKDNVEEYYHEVEEIQKALELK